MPFDADEFDDEPEVTNPGAVSHAVLVERVTEQGRRITRHSKSMGKELERMSISHAELAKRTEAIERWQLKLIAYTGGASAVGGIVVALIAKFLEHAWPK